MEPLISICMPNYNYENYLKESIDSVLNQTYGNFELIIGDDCSTDKSLEVIKSYNDPRIKFFSNEKNLYQFENINKILKIAKGELVAILHSDDKYAPNFLEEVVKTYNQHADKRVFVTGVYFYHSEIGKLIEWNPYSSGGIKPKKEALIRLAQENNVGNSANLVFHRDCLKTVGYLATHVKCIADYDYLMRLANKYDFVYIPKILSYYRIHNSNNTSKYQWKPNRYNEGLEIYNKYFLDSPLLSERTKRKIKYVSSRYRIHKAFNSGIQKNSGKITRLILQFSITNLPELWFEPMWYAAYLNSYFIDERVPKIIQKTGITIGRAILYPQKIFIKHMVEKLVEEEKLC